MQRVEFKRKTMMSGIRHRPLGQPHPGDDSDDEFSDNESTPLTQDLYGGR